MLTDIRFALRTLLEHRGFTAVALVTLAIGIGAPWAPDVDGSCAN